jgi:hypothetical protein
MKKIITLIAGLLLLALPAKAEWQSVSLFGGGVTALYVTNGLIAAQGGGVTNAFTAGYEGTNKVGTVYTNAGSRVVAIAGNDQPLLHDYFPFQTRIDGSQPYTAVSNYFTGIYFPSDYNLNYKLVGSSGANAAVTFVFVPVTGSGADMELAAGEEWTIATTATTTTAITVNTNVPVYKWPGAAGLRLRRITNGDADASSDVIITGLSINGPRR